MHKVGEPGGIEPLAEHDRGAGGEMRHHDHLRDRPERAHIEKHIVRGDAECTDSVVENRAEIAVPQRDAYRRAGGAAAVVQRRQGFCFTRRQFGIVAFDQPVEIQQKFDTGRLVAVGDQSARRRREASRAAMSGQGDFGSIGTRTRPADITP